MGAAGGLLLFLVLLALGFTIEYLPFSPEYSFVDSAITYGLLGIVGLLCVGLGAALGYYPNANKIGKFGIVALAFGIVLIDAYLIVFLLFAKLCC